MLTFKKINNLLGWVLFFVASYVFISTAEPGLSFWDCGEYIASSTKLEVGHAPGAATFQLIGALASLFAFGDSTKYALIINIESAICSAFTIVFMFWTLTHFARKLVLKSSSVHNKAHLGFTEKIVVFGSGVIGSLSFMFSDTFWFSAVEGEVYAMASFFTALLLWLMCRWEKDTNSSGSRKWLVLICFLIGLSVGVHLMVLLVIPALGLMYYYKMYRPRVKNFFIAHLLISALFYFYFKGLFPGVMTLFGRSEVFFVNTLNLPFHSGTLAVFIFLVLFFFFLIRWSHKKNLFFANTLVLCVLYSLIGFSSWMLFPIRAAANPPINLNNPDNAIAMHDYYTRSGQYGDWPILYGQMYTAYLDKEGIIGQKWHGPIYEKNKQSGKYTIIDQETSYEFNPRHTGVFPRMYNSSPEAIENYQRLFGKAQTYFETDPDTGEEIERYQRPTLGQNILFFLDYQIGYMFLRYLFWNYVGRQNDLEGNYEVTKGNWKSGISFIDELHLGPQNNVPKYFQNNKANNTYYGLPLLLGLMGMFFQLRRKFGDFYVLLSVFLLGGVGVIVYTNVKPFEPRERDYALVSAFYVFAIWIGLGAIGVFYWFKEKHRSFHLALTLLGILIFIPLRMAEQNWDDHDRSYRTLPRDIARNYLDTTDYQAILFVYGDNDTYPLWSLQETENYRGDVRILNYTLLGTSWNIDQTQRKVNDSIPIQTTLKHEHYRQGKRDAVVVFPSNEPITAQEAMQWIAREDKQKQMLKKSFLKDTQGKIDFLPTNKIIIPVNKSLALKNGIVTLEDAHKMVSELVLEFPVKEDQPFYLNKNDLMLLDMLANYKWDRPIYFSSGGIYNESNTLYLKNYLQYMGFHYKLVPIRTPPNTKGEWGWVNSEALYQAIKKFHWGNLKESRGYTDYNGRRTILTYRNAVNRASRALIAEGKKKKAQEIMDFLEKEIPQKLYEQHLPLIELAASYIHIGQVGKAKKITQAFQETLLQEIDYYLELPFKYKYWIDDDLLNVMYKYAFLSDEITQAYLEMGHLEQALIYAKETYQEINRRLEQLIKKLVTTSDNLSNEENFNKLIHLHRSLLSTLRRCDVTLSQRYKELFLEKMREQGL